MKNNKKASGTASSFLIASIVAITLLITIGVTVNSFSNPYGVSEIEYFEGYTSEYNNITGTGSQFISDYDFTENSSNPDVERTEDFGFLKAFKMILKIPSLAGSVTTGITKLGADLGIPSAYIYLSIMCLIILLIALVIKIVRGYSEI